MLLKRLGWAGAVGLLVLVLAVPALAQDEGTVVTDDDVNRVASRLYCPQCEGVPLESCGIPACIAWKRQIRDFLTEGWTDQQVIDYFVEQYGQRILDIPNDPLISLLMALVPVTAVIVGGGLLYWQYRKWQRAHAGGPASDETPGETAASSARRSEPDSDDDDDYRARLERELDEV